MKNNNTTNALSEALSTKTKHLIIATKGEQHITVKPNHLYEINIKEGDVLTSDVHLIAKKADNDLEILLENNATVVFDNYFEICTTDLSCLVSLPSTQGVYYVVDDHVTTLADGSQIVYSYGDEQALSAIAEGQSGSFAQSFSDAFSSSLGGNGFFSFLAGIGIGIAGGGDDNTTTGNGGDDNTTTGNGGDDSHTHTQSVIRISNGMLLGSENDDFLQISGTEPATVFGFSGNDVIKGGSFSDELNGGYGDDTIDGGYGDDTIDGGSGNNTLKGGVGKDTFMYTNTEAQYGTTQHDTIVDFQVGADVIDLSYIVSYYYLDEVNLDWIELIDDTTNTFIRINLDLDNGFNDVIITLEGVTGIDLDTMIADGNMVLF